MPCFWPLRGDMGNLDRLKQFVLPENILMDKESGKDLDSGSKNIGYG